MKRSLWTVGLLLLCLVVTARADKPAKNDDSSKFFADKKAVPKFVITPDEAALKTLRQDPRKYVAVNVAVDGVDFESVGMHLKGGAGSFRPVDDKPALTLNFDKFEDKQRFHGLDKIHLNNSVQDPAWMTEIVCGDLFLAAGGADGPGDSRRGRARRPTEGIVRAQGGVQSHLPQGATSRTPRATCTTVGSAPTSIPNCSRAPARKRRRSTPT